MKKQSGFLLGMAMAAASAVQADGFYVYGAVGQTEVRDFVSHSDMEDLAGGELPNYSDDTSDTGYKIQLGYQFNENFAIEGGYVDLGKATAKGSVSGTTFSGLPASYTLKAQSEAEGVNIAGLLLLPTSSGWSLFFKVGAINAKVETKLSDALVIGSSRDTVSDSADDTSLKANFGLGVKWSFMENVGVRAEIERFSKLGDEDETGESDVDLYSIGAYYQF